MNAFPTHNSSEFQESIHPPILKRRTSQQITKTNIKQVAFKRRSYSLRDKSDIMTTSVYLQADEIKEMEQQNEPEKDNPIDKSGTSDPLLMSNCSTKDSLENLKFSTFNKEICDKIQEEPKKEEPTKLTKFGDKSDENPKKLLQPKTKTFSKEKPVIEKRQPTNQKLMDEEIRKNYENEINILRKQLQQAGSNIQPNEESLIKKCATLESQLREAQNDKEYIEDQLNGLRVQLKTWPNKVTELEEENSNLRSRIEDVRAINQQRQNEVDELHQVVKNLETKLWEQSSGSQQQEKIFLQRLMHEYDNLLKDYEMMKLTSLTNERKLYETRNRFNEMNNKISDLEMGIRKLESENNFLKRRLSNDRNFGSNQYRGWSRNMPGYSSFQNEFRTRAESSQEMLDKFARESSMNMPPSGVSGGGDMMSISCYGALPSYSSPNKSEKQATPTNNPVTSQKVASNSPSMAMMSQSMYAGITGIDRSNLLPKEDSSSEAVTPTVEKRHVSIRDLRDFQGNNSNERPVYQRNMSNASSLDLLSEEDPVDMRRGGKKTAAQINAKASLDQWSAHQTQQKMQMTEDERELERRYDQLHQEKRQLLTQLSHVPTNTSNTRNRRSNRELKENLESKLDQIDRQLGLLKMTMKQKHLL